MRHAPLHGRPYDQAQEVRWFEPGEPPQEVLLQAYLRCVLQVTGGERDSEDEAADAVKEFDAAFGEVGVERDRGRNGADLQRGINMEEDYRGDGDEAKSIDLGNEPLLRRNAAELQHSRGGEQDSTWVTPGLRRQSSSTGQPRAVVSHIGCGIVTGMINAKLRGLLMMLVLAGVGDLARAESYKYMR